MTFISRLRNKHSGIIEHSSSYFEMKYVKYGKTLYMCFMAPDQKAAKIKAKSHLYTVNGDKILDIRKLDANNLGKTLTWNKNGRDYSLYQSKRENQKNRKAGL